MSPNCSVNECERPSRSKGYCSPHYKKWKRHGDPLRVMIAPQGSGHMRRGYKVYTVNGKAIRDHVMVAEKALGHKLPLGACVHHVDENRANNRNDNLVICPDNAYHRALHMRLNALKASGHSDWRKCTYCQEYDDPDNMSGHFGSNPSGSYVHAKCRLAYRKNKQIEGLNKIWI